MASAYGVLAQSNPAATSLTPIYTCGVTYTVVSAILIANRDSSAHTFRISIAKAGAGDDVMQYIAYDVNIAANDVVNYQCGITLAATDVIRVYASAQQLSFSVFGEEIT